MIKKIKCAVLNGPSDYRSVSDREVFVKFDESENPIEIIGCPKYDSHKKFCNQRNSSCLLSEGWKKL